jgi:hypothetical protein
MSSRLANGVRIRVDGQGDPWANAHREALGNKFYLQDIDALFGMEVFGANTGDRLFLEYEPDSYENKANVIREFAMVAMFDRKSTLPWARSPQCCLSRGVYLWMCRALRAQQPKAPKFFLVVGRDSPPWQMVEIDIDTGDEINEPMSIDADSFQRVWQQLGLTQLRKDLRRFVNP